MVTAAVDACLCHVGSRLLSLVIIIATATTVGCCHDSWCLCRQVRELDNIPPTAELRKGFLQVVRGVVTHSADYRTHRYATLATPRAAFFR